MSEGFGAGPLVGRETDLATVKAQIEGPGGGALVGAESGMGKTALARAVVDALGDRVHPVWVYASATLSGIPFGA
ncbi:ATP-binding protein, partial [Arthrobacter deserti]|nr:ATP-binding protein [Arthrobacter deserti]